MNIRSKLLLIGYSIVTVRMKDKEKTLLYMVIGVTLAERKSTLRFAKSSFSASEIFFNNIKHLLLLPTKGVLIVL